MVPPHSCGVTTLYVCPERAYNPPLGVAKVAIRQHLVTDCSAERNAKGADPSELEPTPGGCTRLRALCNRTRDSGIMELRSECSLTRPDAVEVRCCSAALERPTCAKDHAQVDVLCRRNDTLIEHELDF